MLTKPKYLLHIPLTDNGNFSDDDDNNFQVRNYHVPKMSCVEMRNRMSYVNKGDESECSSSEGSPVNSPSYDRFHLQEKPKQLTERKCLHSTILI